jgi:hypothetical protein
LGLLIKGGMRRSSHPYLNIFPLFLENFSERFVLGLLIETLFLYKKRKCCPISELEERDSFELLDLDND